MNLQQKLILTIIGMNLMSMPVSAQTKVIPVNTHTEISMDEEISINLLDENEQKQIDELKSVQTLEKEKLEQNTPKETENPVIGLFKLTGYHMGTHTATGTRVTVNRTVAVDPKVIPLGSWIEINIPGDGWKRYHAEDTGSAVKGNIIDIYTESKKACYLDKYNSVVEVRYCK